MKRYLLKLFSWIIGLSLFLTSCQKKEQKRASRCIYDQAVFAQIFVQAAKEPDYFLQFKQNPFFNLLWENLTFEEGAAWLQLIQERHPYLLTEAIDRFRENDAIGSPRTYTYDQVGVFSPSTLRLIAIAGQVQQKVGDLSGLRIVQIGAECGGLCKILHDLATYQSYTLIDLPEQLDLAKKCLDLLKVRNVIFLTPEEISKNADYDLVISDMSFSEFNRFYQQLFFDRILSRSRCGYLLGRIFPKHFGIIAWNAVELKQRFEKMGEFKEWEMQEPSRDRENYLVYWKR